MAQEKKNKKKIEPLRVLNFCSNAIVGGGHALIYRGFAPVIISGGVIPRVWLSMEMPTDRITVLVDENHVLHDQLKVVENKELRTTVITVGDTVILSAQMKQDDFCFVDKADLRPIGINLYGTEKELILGNNRFSGNTIVGGNALIRVGEDMPE